LLWPEGAATAGPQARAHAAAPAVRRKGASFVAPRAARSLGLRPWRTSERLPPSFLRFAPCSRFPAKPSLRLHPRSRRRAGFQRGASAARKP